MRPKVINIKDAPKGWERNPAYVYIGRPKGKKPEDCRVGEYGFLGNPYPLPSGSPRGTTLERYARYLQERILEPEFHQAVKTLSGKTLVCFCKPNPCHGDILADICEELNHD